jgi:hypothetical protein
MSQGTRVPWISQGPQKAPVPDKKHQQTRCACGRRANLVTMSLQYVFVHLGCPWCLGGLCGRLVSLGVGMPGVRGCLVPVGPGVWVSGWSLGAWCLGVWNAWVPGVWVPFGVLVPGVCGRLVSKCLGGAGWCLGVWVVPGVWVLGAWCLGVLVSVWGSGFGWCWAMSGVMFAFLF